MLHNSAIDTRHTPLCASSLHTPRCRKGGSSASTQYAVLRHEGAERSERGRLREWSGRPSPSCRGFSGGAPEAAWGPTVIHPCRSHSHTPGGRRRCEYVPGPGQFFPSLTQSEAEAESHWGGGTYPALKLCHGWTGMAQLTWWV